MELIVNRTIAVQDAAYSQWRHQFIQSSVEMTNKAYDLVMRKVEQEMVRLIHSLVSESITCTNFPLPKSQTVPLVRLGLRNYSVSNEALVTTSSAL